MRRLLLALFISAGSVFGLACNNNSGDAALIQSAVNAGGTVSLTGTCNLNGNTVNLNVPVVINGGATLSSFSNWMFSVNSDSVTFNGLTFQGGSVVHVTGFQRYNFVFTNNVIQDTNGGNGISSDAIWRFGNISHNVMQRLYTVGISMSNCAGWPGGCDNSPGVGIENASSGMSDTTIEWNKFDYLANDAIHIGFNEIMTDALWFPAANNSISYNEFSHVHRIAMEVQGTTSYLQCSSPGNPSNCTDNSLTASTNSKVDGNYLHDPWVLYYSSFGFSLVDGWTAEYANNSIILNSWANAISTSSGGHVASGFEIAGSNKNFQGNVVVSDHMTGLGINPAGWYGANALGSATFGTPQAWTFQNNVYAGDQDSTTNFGADCAGYCPAPTLIFTNQYNFRADTAPNTGHLTTPAIVIAQVGTGSLSGTVETWHHSVISTLSIRNVQYFLDSATVPFFTQELSDVSTTFASDQKWLYHASLDTSTLSGTHTLTATATDVSGATQSSGVTFAGGASGPGASFSPTPLAFGAVVVGSSSSAMVTTLTNGGTTTLTLTVPAVSGANSADFVRTTTCGTSLTAGSTCTVSVVFTPAAIGSRTASITITDNAAGSPHTVALTGRGSSGPSPCLVDIMTNGCFDSGSTGWGFAGGTFASMVVDGSGPGGANAAHITAASAVTLGSNTELTQDNIPLLANTNYKLTFHANATRAQQITLLAEHQTGSFENYGLNASPLITVGDSMYSFNFTTPGTVVANASRLALQTDNQQGTDEFKFTNFVLSTSAATEVNNIQFPANGISHGSITVQFTTLTESQGLRLRYVESPADCKAGAGSGGFVFLAEQTDFKAAFNQYPLGGLKPQTAYNVCPEVSKDYVPGSVAGTWSTGAGGTVTTLPLPAVHPAKPIKPLRFDTRVPDISAYSVVTTDSTCSNFGTLYVAAVTLQATNGTIIKEPFGSTCDPAGFPYQFQAKTPDIHTWNTTDVNTSTGAITWTAHGFAEKDLVKFALNYASGQSFPTSTSCDVGFGAISGGGIQTGQRYPVHVVDADHIQVYCLDGVTLMSFSDVGVAPSGFWAVPFKQVLNSTDGEMEWTRRLPNGNPTPWIIIRSSATDDQLTPEHTQITAAHSPYMVNWVDPVSNVTCGPTDYAHGMIFFGASDPNVQIPTGQIRIGPGIHISTADYGTTALTNDPCFYGVVIDTAPQNDGIIWDRIWYDMPGVPNRTHLDMLWNGSNMAAVDSLWNKLTFFHANDSDSMRATKTSNTVFSVSAGTAYTGPAAVPLSAYTGTISGSGTGRIFGYLDMARGRQLTVAVPSGITVTTSVPSVSTAALGGAVSTCNRFDPWPHEGLHGEISAQELFCIDVTAGVIASVTTGDPTLSEHNPEGSQHLQGGFGPGPYILDGNSSDGAGITWFWDDTGDQKYRGNYTVSRNYLAASLKYLTTSAVSDGYRYFHRQILEWKGGENIDIHGNIMEGGWIEDNNNSPFIAMTSTPSSGGAASAHIGDVNVHDNTFRHGGAIMEGPYVYCSGSGLPCDRPILRAAFTNNLAYDINGTVYKANNPSTSSGNNTQAVGWLMALSTVEDYLFDHNTIMPTAGRVPWIFDIDVQPLEGFTVTNNIIWYTLATGVFGPFGSGNTYAPGCAQGAKSFLDCALTRGPGVPSYTFGNNLIGAGYLDASVPSGQVSSSTMTTGLAGLTNSFLATGSVPGTVAAIGWTSPTIDNILDNYYLLDSSAYKAGRNPYGASSDLGVDAARLYAAQGRLGTPSVPNGHWTTSVTVDYTAADTGTCRVDISPTDVNGVLNATHTTDAGGNTARATVVPTTPDTFYFGVVRCQGNERESQRKFQFQTTH